MIFVCRLPHFYEGEQLGIAGVASGLGAQVVKYKEI